MTYDLFIIGGGINGCGIARDAAGRGLKVFLAEQGDLASGTSSASTKLIHGGLRYLEHYEFRLVREALIELGRAGGMMDANDPLEVGPIRLITEPDLSPNNRDNPSNTAGVTFVGQFLDHDITLTPEQGDHYFFLNSRCNDSSFIRCRVL